MAIYVKTDKRGVIKVSPVIVHRAAPAGDGWQRPSSRPAVPVINEGEQVMYWLFGVSENSPNDFAIQLSTSAGQYRMEWGDGTSNDYASATTAEHMFDYASVSGNPTEEGYKWVWIKATPLTGNITGITINVRHSLRPTASSSNIFVPQVFEWYLQAPYISTFTFTVTPLTRYMLLDILDYKGENNITNFSYFAGYLFNIKKLNIYTSKGTNFSYFMNSCYSRTFELDIDLSNATNFTNLYNSNYAYNRPVVLDLEKVTNITSFLASCYAIPFIRLKNMTASIAAVDTSNKPLDVPALVDLFGDLYNRSATTTGTLTITGCFGTARLTEEQKNIAKNKNWTIVE